MPALTRSASLWAALALNPSTTHQQHPIHALPAELLLSIIDLLPPESFINFALAAYPLLRTHGLAPPLSAPRVGYITKTPIPGPRPPHLHALPAEIVLCIMDQLNPSDTMRFVVANYQDLARQGIAPALTWEIVGSLQRAAGKSPAACAPVGRKRRKVRRKARVR